MQEYLSEISKDHPVSTVLLQELMRQEDQVRSGQETSWDQQADVNRRTVMYCASDLHEYEERKAKANAWTGPNKIRFSPSAANGCFRRMWFRHYAAPVDAVSTGDTVAGYFMRTLGTMAHMGVQLLLAQAGVLKKRELRLTRTNPAVSGFCDGLLDISGQLYILEIKTISDNKLRAVAGQPLPYHVAQCRLYQSVLPHAVSLLYLTREHCKLQEHVIDYDKEEVRKVLQQPRQHERFVRTKVLPKRVSNHLGKPPCLWCEFTNVCFSGEPLKEFVAKVKGGKA